MVYVYAIENKLPVPIGDENNLHDDYVEDTVINDMLFGSYNETERLIETRNLILPKLMSGKLEG